MGEPGPELESALKELSSEIGRRRRQGLPVDDLIERHGRLVGGMQRGADQRGAAQRKAAQRKAAQPQYRVDEVVGFESDDTLAKPWSDLFLASKAYAPYMSWEWQRAWCLTYGSGRPTRLLAVRQTPSDRLVGLLPLSQGRPHVLTPFQHAAICGSQPGAVLYTHPLIASDVDHDAVAALLAESLKQSRTFLVGGYWDDGDPGAHALVSALQRSRFSVLREPLLPARWDTLPDTLDDFIRQLPARTRRNRIRHYERQGWLEDRELVLETYEDADEIVPRLRVFPRFHEAKYGFNSTWRRQPLMEFLTECVRSSTDVKPILWMLMHGTAPAAAMLGWLWEGRFFASALAYDPADEQFEPGHVLITRTVADLIQRGAKLLDFGPGMAYKAYYFRRQRPFVRLLAGPYGPRTERALSTMFLLRPPVTALWRAREAVWRGLRKLRPGG